MGAMADLGNLKRGQGGGLLYSHPYMGTALFSPLHGRVKSWISTHIMENRFTFSLKWKKMCPLSTKEDKVELRWKIKIIFSLYHIILWSHKIKERHPSDFEGKNVGVFWRNKQCVPQVTLGPLASSLMVVSFCSALSLDLDKDQRRGASSLIKKEENIGVCLGIFILCPFATPQLSLLFENLRE